MRPNRAVIAVILGAIVLVACGLSPGTSPEPTVCDGISSEVGGCDPRLPKFAGTTCDDVAREVGGALDSRLLEIYRGPEMVGDESKAVRAAHLTGAITSLANRHLRRLGLIKECTAPTFLDVAETQFSADLRAHAGEILYDGPPVSYAEWRQALLGMLLILDQAEDASVSPS